jgi:hypothetical protein
MCRLPTLSVVVLCMEREREREHIMAHPQPQLAAHVFLICRNISYTYPALSSILNHVSDVSDITLYVYSTVDEFKGYQQIIRQIREEYNTPARMPHMYCIRHHGDNVDQVRILFDNYQISHIVMMEDAYCFRSAIRLHVAMGCLHQDSECGALSLTAAHVARYQTADIIVARDHAFWKQPLRHADLHVHLTCSIWRQSDVWSILQSCPKQMLFQSWTSVVEHMTAERIWQRDRRYYLCYEPSPIHSTPSYDVRDAAARAWLLAQDTSELLVVQPVREDEKSDSVHS